MFLGVILSLISVVADLTYIPNILLLSLLFGVSLGLGMPSSYALFSQTINIEKRGLTAGIIFLLSGVMMVALGMFSRETLAYK